MLYLNLWTYYIALIETSIRLYDKFCCMVGDAYKDEGYVSCFFVNNDKHNDILQVHKAK